MKRQCALICAISTNCDYMFFDETFDGLDPVIRNTMKKILIKQMNKKRTTIVMTSHNLRELETFVIILVYYIKVVFYLRVI